MGSKFSTSPGDSVSTLSMMPPDHFELPIGNQKIELVIYKPHKYDPSQKYPILIIPDADPMLGIIKTLNFLWSEEQYAIPTILVGIPFGQTPGSIWVNRCYYFLPDSVGIINYYGNSFPVKNGGGAQEFAQFLDNQVLPTLDKEYNVDQDRVGLIGFSMGAFLPPGIS
ncbi:hypothetical protein IID10_14090 [candidate division KSB1 bacterium]|nr:hypothetical protein [candidate division KSB1 bacterium]TDI95185.1 MAG: hypothetical protein E2O76_13790 [Caldithrix sp.]